MAKKYLPSFPSKRSFSEKFYPARPTQVLRKARSIAQTQVKMAKKLGPPLASNRAYVTWLRDQSMLHNATQQALRYSGKSRLWQNPFAKPRPRSAVNKASVWYTAYPISMISKNDKSLISNLGDDDLWAAFQEIGIKGLHTGPMKQAGGLEKWAQTPSIDGHFDRVSTRIDPVFGSETQFQEMCEAATRHDGIIIDDIVPGHTGKGSDFRLAEMNYKEYPGIFHMIEIEAKDWGLLPDVPDGKDSVNIDAIAEEKLKKAEYIVGKLQRVIFFEPGVKETNWSVTRPVKGVDGVRRRWVYLHYFKDGQPSINWLDPSFAGIKLVIGDALHSIGDLGSGGLRLDANGFLGIEKSDDNAPAWSEGHPLSEAANQLIAGMVRKVGGFTFQELNLSIDDIKAMSEDGADLSYDFINRPAYHHAFATGDTEFLRLMLHESKRLGVDPASLVHALQNHDELTFELVHFWTIHKDDEYEYRNHRLTGFELRHIIREDLKQKLTGSHAPYNLPFTENGIACTTASIITAVLGYEDLNSLTEEDVASIKKAHLLLAMFNALQPGVFALSGWDLSGSLTIDPAEVEDLVRDGDTRWVNRGAYDLMNKHPDVEATTAGIPKANNLYGTLPEQLEDENSFAMQLKRVLAVREKYGISTSHQVDVPVASNGSILVMIHRLPSGQLQATVLNFANEPVTGIISSESLPAGSNVTDMFTDEVIATVGENDSFSIALEPHEGTSLLISTQTA